MPAAQAPAFALRSLDGPAAQAMSACGVPTARLAPGWRPAFGVLARDARRSGFTLIEFLIAMMIASAALGLAYYLFQNTASATRVGMERSSIYQGALMAETRLRMDLSSMIGPKNAADVSAGAIVIIPAMRKGVIPTAAQNGEQSVAQLRSDQLVAFYDASLGGLIRGESASGTTLKSLTLGGVRSRQAKFWMGHVQPKGGMPASAADWVLGRQATLLCDPDTTVVNTPATLDASAILSPASAVSEAGDVAPWSLGEVANWMRKPGRTDDEMIAAFAVKPGDVDDYANLPQVETQPLVDDALGVADVFGGHRIFLNNCSEFMVQYSADLNFNGLVDTDGADDYSGQIKWYPDDKDVFDATRPGHAAAIRPVVFYPQDDQPRVWHIGSYQGPDSAQYRKNRWGDFTPYPAVGGLEFGDALPDATAYGAAMAAYASHHNNFRPSPVIPPAQSKWPQLIRIRYRLHDAHHQVFSYMDEFEVNRRDDNGVGGVDEPAENRMAGIWFEHVFSVPYPRPN